MGISDPYRIGGWWQVEPKAGRYFHGLHLLALMLEGATSGALDPRPLGVGGGDAGDELGRFKADAALLKRIDHVVQPLTAACQADFAPERGARHAEPLARVVGFGGKAKRLPAAKRQEPLRHPAEEEIATGEFCAVVTDACVERLDAERKIVDIGRLRDLVSC